MTIKITAFCSGLTPQFAIGGKKWKESEKLKCTHNIMSRISEQESLQVLLKMKNDRRSSK
jgi:hypothetical protein